MDRLSPEILSIVVSYFMIKPPAPFAPRRRMLGQAAPAPPKPVCGPYTLSRNWQHAVEAQTFASIRLKSTELPEFAAIFSDTRRRGLLRDLTFVVCLPTHGDTRKDHAINVAAFADALKDLLSLLALWEQHATGDEALPTLKLWLTFSYNIRMDGPVDHHFNVLKSSAARRYLEADVDEFAVVRRISAFRIDVSPGRAPHPTTLCRLAGHFPQLRELDIEYRDPALKRRDMRSDHRLALAAGLRELRLLPELSKLHVRRQGGWDPVNHSFACQDLEDDQHVDPLCESIRQLAEAGRLTELDLTDVLISSDLFRNRRPGALYEEKPMSALRRLHIQDGLLSPSGKWYYTGNPDEVAPDSPRSVFDSDDDVEEGDDNSDSNDEDHEDRDAAANGEQPHHMWRTRPDPETFDPLITDMAKALHHMPALKRARLVIGTSLSQPVGVVVQCVKGGEGFFRPPDRRKDTDADKTTARCKAWVGTATEWEVPREVKAAWETWVGEQGQVDVAKWP
ncbi:hypothetical protein E8E14_014495 [Neopestalotiopsis sp. 37M]|nr:hypothetical protein E8E14_014495 [Neopestalotiopsis sp. 37M]